MYGTALRIECGDRVTKKTTRHGTYDVGALSVSIYAYHWYVYHGEEEIFYSMAETDENYDRMQNLIVGRKLTDILTQQPEEHIIFSFSNDVKLYVDYAETDEELNSYMGMATIFLPDGSIISASGNRDFIVTDENWKTESNSE